MSLHKEEQTHRTMKKLLFFIVVICVFGLAGCNKSPKQSLIMNETDTNEWLRKEHSNEIAVETSFTPTVDIEYIESLSLETLVIQNFYRKTFRELQKDNPSITYQDYEKYVEDYRENERRLHEISTFGVKVKYVPVNSNLAKAYCLQAPYQFKKHNWDYVNNVCNEHRAAQRKEDEQNAQKAWEKYLE